MSLHKWRMPTHDALRLQVSLLHYTQIQTQDQLVTMLIKGMAARCECRYVRRELWPSMQSHASLPIQQWSRSALQEERGVLAEQRVVLEQEPVSGVWIENELGVGQPLRQDKRVHGRDDQ